MKNGYYVKQLQRAFHVQNKCYVHDIYRRTSSIIYKTRLVSTNGITMKYQIFSWWAYDLSSYRYLRYLSVSVGLYIKPGVANNQRIHEPLNMPRRELCNDSLWTNNSCENLNNILKLAIKWKPQQMLELIRMLQRDVEKQFVDLKRAICSKCNYVLCEAARDLIDHWK